jgi:hypothetical protein
MSGQTSLKASGITGSALSRGYFVSFGISPIRQKNRHLGSGPDVGMGLFSSGI